MMRRLAGAGGRPSGYRGSLVAGNVTAGVTIGLTADLHFTCQPGTQASTSTLKHWQLADTEH